MMVEKDIVERLRECERSGEARMFEAENNPEIFRTAADDIEQARELAKLRNEQIDRDQKEIERLREALEKIAANDWEASYFARAALQSKGEG
jgi:RNA polymerase-binding transcription factor DksA